jgi:hypothetical protein
MFDVMMRAVEARRTPEHLHGARCTNPSAGWKFSCISGIAICALNRSFG